MVQPLLRIALFSFVLAPAGLLQAQVDHLWGLTATGGLYDMGTLFHVGVDGSDFTVAHHFDEFSGWGPEGTLCLASNGKLYGTTNLGGSGTPDAGTLFSYDPATEVYTVLVDFNLTNGGYPWGGLVTGSDGMLYGASYGGGTGGGGSIFRVDPADDSYTIMYALVAGQDGSGITNVLSEASDGWYYGCAAYGGAYNSGTLFRFQPATSTFEKLHDLEGGLLGDTPYGSLCEAGDGWFHGTTFSGGSTDDGTYFRYHPATDTFEKLFDFTGPNGQSPWNSPVRTGLDELYGTASMGGLNTGGLVYRMTPSSGTFSEAFSFSLTNGGTLFGGLLHTTDGQLYGLASFGGTYFQGVVYRIDPTTNEMTTLHNFNGPTDGYSPRGDLISGGPFTAVPEALAALRFGVHPNPASGATTLTFSSAPPPGARLRITNALGQVVAEQALTALRHVVPLPAAPGAYLLTVATATTNASRRVVVE